MKTVVAIALLFIYLVFLVSIIIVIIFLTAATQESPNLEEAIKTHATNTHVSDLIVTLTTVPTRLSNPGFQHTIAGLCAQTCRAKEIRLYIPKVLKRTGEAYVIPDWLHHTPVKLCETEDFGPVTKLLGALQTAASDDKFLVCDDDSVMPNNWIQSYVNAVAQYPGVALTTEGYKVTNFETNQRMYYDGSQSELAPLATHLINRFFSHHFLQPDEKPVQVHVLQGYVSFLVSKNMIDHSKLKEMISQSKQAFVNDDIIISAHLAENNIPIYVCYGLVKDRSLQWQADAVALRSNTNKTQLNQVPSDLYCLRQYRHLFEKIK